MRVIYFLIGAGMIVLGALAAMGVIGAAEETHRHMR